MTPLDAREWLEAQRLAGNPFARELLEMLDEQDHLRACEDIVTDLKKKAPADLVKKWDKANEPWRLVEWFGDREALLAEVEEVTAEHSEGVDWPNGTKPGDVSDAYRHFARHPKAQRNPNWRAKVRQKLQQCGNRIGRNEYVAA